MESPIKDDLRDKSIFFANSQGEALPLSVEEALAQGRTDFRGWYCAIGIDNLHISPDGDLYGGACRNNGHLGNVYEKSFFLKNEWHKCTRVLCNCGADMQIRKAKDKKYIPLTFEEMPAKKVTHLEEPVYVAPIHQEMHKKHPLTLTWDLGRRCNYSCAYCSETIANNYESHRSWGSLMFAWDGLELVFLRDKKAKFVFTGGEPTINPSYLDFVKMIHQKGHFIHTTTNGSRLPEYFAELLEYSFIGFSYHMEFAKIEHYVKVMTALIEKKKSHETSKNNWCGVRIMVPPGKYKDAFHIRETLLNIPGFLESGIFMFMSPCYVKDTHAALMPYEPQELELISQYA